MRVITRKLLCFLPHPADGWVEEKVEKTGKEEGDEGHHKKVGEENIVPHIGANIWCLIW